MEKVIGDIDWEFYNKYPRIYAVAIIHGFTKNDVEIFIDKIGRNELCQNLYRNTSSYETTLRMLMVRLGVNKSDFQTMINNIARKAPEELRELVGLQCIPIVNALVE